MALDVILRRIVWRTTPDILVSFTLIDADVVEEHLRWEDESFWFDDLPVSYVDISNELEEWTWVE